MIAVALAGAAGWAAIAVVVALGVGRAIRVSRQPDAAPPAEQPPAE